jgi:hypothetical protein
MPELYHGASVQTLTTTGDKNQELLRASGLNITDALEQSYCIASAYFVNPFVGDKDLIGLAKRSKIDPPHRNSRGNGVRHHSNLSCQIDLSAIIAVTDLISPTPL